MKSANSVNGGRKMSQSQNFESLVGKFWKCPAAYWGKEYEKDVIEDPSLPS